MYNILLNPVTMNVAGIALKELGLLALKESTKHVAKLATKIIVSGAVQGATTYVQYSLNKKSTEKALAEAEDIKKKNNLTELPEEERVRINKGIRNRQYGINIGTSAAAAFVSTVASFGICKGIDASNINIT